MLLVFVQKIFFFLLLPLYGVSNNFFFLFVVSLLYIFFLNNMVDTILSWKSFQFIFYTFVVVGTILFEC